MTLLHPVKRPAAWATLAPYTAPTGSMRPEAVVLRELDLEQRQRPWTATQARTDLALIAGYPAPDCTQLREPRRLARRWGWRPGRVAALLTRPTAPAAVVAPLCAADAPRGDEGCALGSATVTVFLRPRVRR